MTNQAVMRKREPVVASRCKPVDGERVNGREPCYRLRINSRSNQVGLPESKGWRG